MSQTSASTTITFAVVSGTDGEGNNSISVELDAAANNSKSTFLPGDTAHFLVHTNPSELAVSVDTTVGSVAANGTKIVEVEEQLQFVQSDEATLGRVPNGPVTTSWVGRAGGSPTVSGTSIKLLVATNGVLKCTYSTIAKSYRLAGVTLPPGLDEIQALIVVAPTT